MEGDRVAPVVVLGGKGHAEVTACLVQAIASAGGGYRFMGYLNDRLPPGAPLFGGEVLGPFESWSRLPAQTLFVAPLFKPKFALRNVARLKSLGIPEGRCARLIHPAAHCAGDLEIGVGTTIDAGAYVGPSTQLGRHTCVKFGASVAHDCQVDDYACIGTQSLLGGESRIEEGAYVAPGSIVGEGVRVGRYSVVGLGSVAMQDVPDNAIVAGTPARVIGEIDIGMLENAGT